MRSKKGTSFPKKGTFVHRSGRGDGGDVYARRVGGGFFAAGREHQGGGADAKRQAPHFGARGNTHGVRHDGVLSNTHRLFSPAS